MKWEYLVVTVEKFLYDMLKIGNDGWELLAVYNDLVYFKRPQRDDSGPRDEIGILLTDLSKRSDPTSKTAANFIRNTIGIANTIKNEGWQFEVGHDLVEDILSLRNWTE